MVTVVLVKDFAWLHESCIDKFFSCSGLKEKDAVNIKLETSKLADSNLKLYPCI